jgi:hypothetical protein
MDHEQRRDELRIQRQQHRKQRHQQQQQRHQQEQQHPYVGSGRDLPDKQHQSKHNPVSEVTKAPRRGADQ